MSAWRWKKWDKTVKHKDTDKHRLHLHVLCLLLVQQCAMGTLIKVVLQNASLLWPPGGTFTILYSNTSIHTVGEWENHWGQLKAYRCMSQHYCAMGSINHACTSMIRSKTCKINKLEFIPKNSLSWWSFFYNILKMVLKLSSWIPCHRLKFSICFF